MRYVYLFILFLCSCYVNAQITDTQIRVRNDQQPDSLLIMTNDSNNLSPYYKTGKWRLASDVIGAAAGDSDWWKLGGTAIPTNSDSAYRSGYTLFTGLSGGLATKIEMLKDGVLQFDQDTSTTTGRYLIKSQPQQQGYGNTSFNFTTISQPNTGIDRNNDVFSIGWNLNPGGGVLVPGEIGFGMQFEGFYRTSGSDYGEWHIVHIDTNGVVRKPISWFLNHYDPSLWAGDFLASEIQFNDPTNNLPFAEFERSNTTSASFKMLGSASGQGAEFYLDEAGDNLQITSFGLTNPHMYLFDNVGTSFVHVNYLEYLNAGTDAIRIAGQDANGLLTDVPTGWGIDLSGSGTLVVDSSQVATQYDLTTISGGSTDLSIGGSGPSYTIESSTGTDVTVSNVYGLTLSESPANTLNFQVDSSKLATQYDISGFGTMSNWLLAASGTGGTETVTNGETVTVSETTGLDVTRSTNTVSVALSIDEFSTDAASEGDELLLAYDPSGTNHELFDINDLPYVATEVDGSTTNELNTIEEGNVSVQTSNTNIDFQTMFDVATDGAGEVNVSFDGGEATTVTTAESDDYLLVWDSGLTQNQKMLWSDFVIDIIGFEEDNVNEGSGNTLDVGTGIDLSVTGAEADYTLDFNEFTTDAATEGDEYVILYDPSAVAQEKVLISSFGGADGNGIYTGDGTVPTDVDAAVTDSLEFNGTLKIINDANDYVGIGAQSPEAKLHVRGTSGADFMLEETGGTSLMSTKAISGGVESPFQLKVFNKDANIDISGDYYQMGNITFGKNSATVPGGTINFNVGYDSLNLDGVLTLKSRESGATDGIVNVVGGLRLKWTTSASSSVTLNTGDYGLSMTTTGAKTATIPDAVSGIVGQELMIFNSSSSGDVTVSITGGSGDTIYGDPVLAPNESCKVICVAANKWITNN